MSRLRLRLAEIWIPPTWRRKALSDLAALTAGAFGAPPPFLDGLDWPARLEAYARFTSAEAERVLARPEELAVVRSRLRTRARDFGERLRRRLGASSRTDALRLARLLYGEIGIDFEGRPDGEVLIRACGFSRHYGGEVCALISALDEGVLAGLTGGGRLEFRERLTEGGAACRAVFHFEEDP
jgi:hypothetical protein